MFDQDFYHNVLEFDVHHSSHGVLLSSHQGGPKDHPHIGRCHKILFAVLTHTARRKKKMMKKIHFSSNESYARC